MTLRLLTEAEAADLVGVKPSTIRSWVRRGHLTPLDDLDGDGRRWFADVDVYIAERKARKNRRNTCR